MKKLCTLALVALLGAGAWVGSSSAQTAGAKSKPKTETKAGKKKKGVVVDTTKKTPPPPKGSIEAVIKPGAKRTVGLFTVIEQEGKYYFLIPRTMLGRDMMQVNRVSKAPADAGVYAGDPINESMIRWTESPDQKKLFIEEISTRETPRDSGDMYAAVMRSNLQPIVEAFEVKGVNKAKDTLLIEVTDFVAGPSALTGLNVSIRLNSNFSDVQKDKSYVASIKPYPTNVEMKSIKSYLMTPRSTNPLYRPSPVPMTFEINSSMVLLPEVPMQARYVDSRVGFFASHYVDYQQNPQGVRNLGLITRWRLEPKPEDLEAYKRGELVEPAKPIVYYIDPATPEKWVPYLMAGVNDWTVAFEKAGFKNAIMAKRAPTPAEDSTWSLEDARYSVIVYMPSNIPNAMGPHVGDPRSGEIIESHIHWYHNVMKLLHDWYMIQVGPNDPRSRKMEFDEELMGELIRFVSSHEVGHTLGLRHNFGSSAMTPADSLRNIDYLRRHGHTASIMDYARFNYVAQPEDNIPVELLYPRIGEYDQWAIEWGYRRFPELITPQSEETKLNQWIIEKSKNPLLFFGHEMSADDPRLQNEDLGDNQMKSNELGIKNLKIVLAGLPQWTRTPNDGYGDLRELYSQTITQVMRYNGHVAKWVGGIYQTPKSIEQPGAVYTFVEKAKQKEAMAFLERHVFTTPTWVLNEDIFSKTGIQGASIIGTIQSSVLSRLLTVRVLNNLVRSEVAQGKANAYTVTEFFADMNRNVWSGTPDVYRRQMQVAYVDRMIGLTKESSASEVAARATYELKALGGRLKVSTSADPAVKAHYQYLTKKIADALDPK